MLNPKAVVVDSSVIVKWVNQQNEKLIEKSDKLLEDCRKGAISLVAPELAKYEVGNVLWKKGMELPQTLASLGTVYAIPIEFVVQQESYTIAAMEIAKKADITFYDATFVGLAQNLKASLVTDNPKHLKKFEGVKVVALKDYK